MDMYQNNNPYLMLPGMTPDEWGYIQQALSQLSENQQKYFYMAYSTKRKSPQDLLIFCVVGFFVPGIQRFIIGQIGLGILYLFTAGICVIGTIVDLVNHRTLANEFNQKMAYESFQLAKLNN